MPDGAIQQDYVYRPAVRDKTAPLIMLAGPPGTGKTYSALRLARGMAGPEGRIFLADTDNGRALFYADEFRFEHLNLHEPFRPIIFEEAAKQAQKNGAAVLVIDNFMAEHAGPGGLLEWHQEINVRMASRGDESRFEARLESTKMLAWIEPKTQHKRMRERLYQLNMPVILCCGAERKMAMVKQTEGRDRGKVIPVDQGFQPICGQDIPWAMTLSLMLEDPHRPGVPCPIKALMPALKPIISLEAPLDEATGALIAAWAHGERKTPASSIAALPARKEGSSPPASQNPPPDASAPPDGSPPGDDPPPSEPSDPTPDTGGPPDQPEDHPALTQEQRIEAGAKALGERFLTTADRRDHLSIVDDPEVQKQIRFLQRQRKALYDQHVKPFVTASWTRTDPKKPAAQHGDLSL
jgi:hypothetical protein